MVGMAGAGGSGEVAGADFCGLAGLPWLGVCLRGAARVDFGLDGSCLGLRRLSLAAWRSVAWLASGALLDAERVMREFVAGLTGLIGRAHG